MNVPVTGAILAGGRSSRLRAADGRFKPDIEMSDGRAMIEHVQDALAPLCRRVVIVGDCNTLPRLRRLADQRENCGPLGGIESLLGCGLDEHYLVVPCDLPRLTAGTLARLLVHADAPAAVFDIRAHPLPARISAGALPTVQELLDSGERRVWQLMSRLEACEVRQPPALEPQLWNVNTADDLRAVNEGAKAPSGRRER